MGWGGRVERGEWTCFVRVMSGADTFYVGGDCGLVWVRC